MAPYVRRLWKECSATELAALSDEAIDSICESLDDLSAKWGRLRIGEGLSVVWPD
jgi:hypothetical protein